MKNVRPRHPDASARVDGHPAGDIVWLTVSGQGISMVRDRILLVVYDRVWRPR